MKNKNTGEKKIKRKRKNTLSIENNPAIWVERSFIHLQEPNRVVYFILGSKPIPYPNGASSRILYIGESSRKDLSERPLESLKEHAVEFLNIRGMKYLTVICVRLRARQKIKMSKLLQDALLFEFKALYGALPKGNSQSGTEHKHWPIERLREILRKYEKASGADIRSK